MKVAAVQHDIAWEDPHATLARLAPLVARAAETGAQLVVLAEMFATGFSMAVERVAEDVDGPSSSFLTEQAEVCGVSICGSIPLRPRPDARPVNRLVLAHPDGTTVHYDKRHPFRYSGEHEHYAAGTESVVADVGDVRLALTVCYDLRFADLYWALAPAVDAYVVVANWPRSRRHHWTTLLSARAIENQAYVIGVNRVGQGGGLDYAGDSRIVDPSGETVASAAGGEAILVGEIDPGVVADTRRRFPFLADR